jgi:UDP-GlcNAc:undecaprenyl-phosphate GlcNAc-1-phosphate transferase
MKSYLILFTTSAVLALLLTPLVRRWATKWGALDHPDGKRRIHHHPMPRLGGLAIFLSTLITLACVPLLGNLVSQGFHASWAKVAVLLGTAILMLLLGIWDDFRGSTATTKLVVQLLGAGILYANGYGIGNLSLPGGGYWELPVLLSFPLTALWVLGLTNAFNLIDGIDGLAAGASGFALFSLFIFSLAQGHPEITLLSIILVGSIMGFLRYNFNPATIFLGDSGSLFLGFLAAALSLAGAQKGHTLVAIAIPLVSFGLPVTEIGLSIVRRIASGEPVFKSDRRHIHHMLLRQGLTQRQAVILLYGVCALFTLFGLMLLNPERNRTALIMFILGVGMLIGVQRLRYPELNTLGQRLRAGVGRRQRAFAFNSRLRTSCAKVRQAQTTEQLLAALAKLCAEQAFDQLTLELQQAPAAAPVGTPAHLSAHPHPPRVKQDPGAWTWQWARGEANPSSAATDSQCWMLRAPLTDEQGATFGSLTIYCNLDNSQLKTTLVQVCDTLRLDLSASLERLNRSQPLQFNGKLHRVAAWS